MNRYETIISAVTNSHLSGEMLSAVVGAASRAAPSSSLRGARALAARRSVCSAPPPGVWVTVTVPEDARAEFLRVMAADVKGVRPARPPSLPLANRRPPMRH